MPALAGRRARRPPRDRPARCARQRPPPRARARLDERGLGLHEAVEQRVELGDRGRVEGLPERRARRLLPRLRGGSTGVADGSVGIGDARREQLERARVVGADAREPGRLRAQRLLAARERGARLGEVGGAPERARDVRRRARLVELAGERIEARGALLERRLAGLRRAHVLRAVAQVALLRGADAAADGRARARRGDVDAARQRARRKSSAARPTDG